MTETKSKINDLYWQSGIYMLRFTDLPYFYIGSTSQYFIQRLEQHIYQLQKDKSCNKKLQSIFNQNKDKDLELYVLQIIYSFNKNDFSKLEHKWLKLSQQQPENSLNIKKYGTGGSGLFCRDKKNDHSVICSITNKENNKKYLSVHQTLELFTSHNIKNLISGQHKNIDLQNDFNVYGLDSFIFRTIKNYNYKDYYLYRSKLSSTDYTQPPTLRTILMSSIQI